MKDPFYYGNNKTINSLYLWFLNFSIVPTLNSIDRLKYLRKLLIFRLFFSLFRIDNDGTNRAPLPKPLIKVNPKKEQQLEQHHVPVINAIKEHPIIEDDAVQKQGRGNCYTEPMHQNNCVTSELYLITWNVRCFVKLSLQSRAYELTTNKVKTFRLSLSLYISNVQIETNVN